MSSIAFGMRGKMQPTIPVDEAHLHIGKELFTTDWLTISEDRVKQFRWSTFANGDDADMEMCLTNPVGYENVDGFMLVSLLITAHFNNNPINSPGAFGLNYALENFRFPAPVFLEQRVKVSATLTDVRSHAKGTLITTHNVMDLEGSERPVLVGDWTNLVVTDGQ